MVNYHQKDLLNIVTARLEAHNTNDWRHQCNQSYTCAAIIGGASYYAFFTGDLQLTIHCIKSAKKKNPRLDLEDELSKLIGSLEGLKAYKPLQIVGTILDTAAAKKLGKKIELENVDKIDETQRKQIAEELAKDLRQTELWSAISDYLFFDFTGHTPKTPIALDCIKAIIIAINGPAKKALGR